MTLFIAGLDDVECADVELGFWLAQKPHVERHWRGNWIRAGRSARLLRISATSYSRNGDQESMRLYPRRGELGLRALSISRWADTGFRRAQMFSLGMVDASRRRGFPEPDV